MAINGKLNLKRFLICESLFISAGLMTMGLLLSKFLGFLREILIAKVFGVSYLCDAYLVAILFPISIMGAVSQSMGVSLIPLFSKKDFSKYHLSLFIISLLSLFFSFLVFLFPQLVINVIGQGFPITVKEQAKILLRNMAPAVFFIGISGFLNAFSYVNKNYFFPALSGILYNSGLILGIVYLYKLFSLSGLAFSVNLASFLYILLPLTFFLKREKAIRNLNIAKEEALYFLKFLFLSFLPYLLVSSVSQINVAIDRAIASFLEEGSISALNFAYKIIELPLGIFGFAFATVLMPYFSEKFYNGEKEQMIKQANNFLFFLSLIILPITLAFILLNEEIIRIVYFRGAFNEKALIMTKEALSFYSLGLLAYCANLILIRLFWSMGEIKLPIIISTIAVLLNLILDLILAKFLSYKGLALATSLSGIFRFLLFAFCLSYYFQFRLRLVNWKEIFNGKYDG
uniref:Lipid II flippase MurJ n=1 Tax=candidate division WOR-3 bacterium TaxID=2052148 RepID=A0A7V4E2M2_UNCW3